MMGLAEWLNRPEPRTLVAYLQRRQAQTVATFLGGSPVDPVTQGRASAFSELEKLLRMSSDKVEEAFNNVLKGANKT